MAINLSKNDVPNFVNHPAHIAEDEFGKKLYVIKSIKDDVEYKIWARSYEEALRCLPDIESF